jgi:hypothetical protein
VGKRFENEDWSGAYFHNVDFSGSRVQEGNFDGASFSGFAGSLKINGFEVWPLIEAELVRVHPEYAEVRRPPLDAEGCGRAVDVVLGQLDETTARVMNLSDEQRRQRVDDEWSALESMRHLVYVIDVWLRTVIRGEADALDPIGLPNTADPPIDPDVDPTFEDVHAVWMQRADLLRTYVHAIDPDELDHPPAGPDYEPSIRDALWVIFYELWWHNHYMTRDLATLQSS